MKKSIASLLSGTVALTLAGAAYAAPVSSAEQAHTRGGCPASIAETHDYDKDGLSDSCDLTVFLVKNDERGGLSLELAPGARVDSMMIADISNQTQEAVYWSLELEGPRGVTARQQDGWVTPGDSQSISLDIDLSSVEPGALLEQSVTLKVGNEVHHIPLAIAVKNAEARTLAGTCNYSVYLDSIKVVTGQGGLEGDAEVELFTSLQTPTGNVANDWPSAGGYMRIAVGATKYINIFMSSASVATGAHVNLPVNYSIREDDDTSGDDWGSASGSLSFDCTSGTSTAYSTTRVQDDSGGKYDVILRSTWSGN
ncbi:hypothetical protein [Cystobacter ferrugineus]|uniref:Uncharacterized protein n=1 Tax=Cystobacter ferrugineus TaxID=83449 RepID=A0A1L9B7V5_9BACT|nr:hypothetical protein [Cystobacter ferrugineus]OJH38334.1 hypothetical protein BON30_24680 [Cystobacter ferrugineus]